MYSILHICINHMWRTALITSSHSQMRLIETTAGAPMDKAAKVAATLSPRLDAQTE